MQIYRFNSTNTKNSLELFDRLFITRRPRDETDLTTVLFLNFVMCTVPANNFTAIIKRSNTTRHIIYA